MVKCVYKTGEKTIYCLGAFHKKISLLTRDLSANTSDMLQYGLTETVLKTVRAEVKNLSFQSGVAPYINTNIEDVPTHRITIKYIDNVDIITGIELNNKKYRITKITNIEERNKYLEFFCVERGDKDVTANQI